MKNRKCEPPAKVNLGLQVLSRRPDGFHDIATVFQTLDLCDSLGVTLTNDGRILLSVVNSDIAADESNLCYRAAELFGQKHPGFAGCRIELEKHIPDGAGLGGGSSDAAWTLNCLNELCDGPFGPADLQEMAAGLGSDVPFFLQGGTAIGRGRGEILTPLTNAWQFFVVVVCPTTRISTAWAYENRKMSLTSQPNCHIFDILLTKPIEPEDFHKYFTNDFEPLVFARFPFLSEIKQRLYDMDAFYASMSGSGSAIFGLFFDQDNASAAKQEFVGRHAVYLAKTISASPAEP